MARKTMYRGFELIIDLENGEAKAIRGDKSLFTEVVDEFGTWETQEDALDEIRDAVDEELGA